MSRLVVIAVMTLLACQAAWAEPLFVAYPPRPPYNYTEGGKPAGHLFDLAAKVLKSAGIEAAFTEMPSKRILVEIERPDSRLCSFGWFKNAEREQFAAFSLPFYRDQPLVALILKNNEALFAGKSSFADICADKNLVLGLVRGWSYGAAADKIVTQYKPRIMDIPERTQQALMLAGERFTHTLVREPEVAEVIALTQLPESRFAVVRLSDLGQGENRYFMCAKAAAQAIPRIDEAIRKLGLADDISPAR